MRQQETFTCMQMLFSGTLPYPPLRRETWDVKLHQCMFESSVERLYQKSLEMIQFHIWMQKQKRLKMASIFHKCKLSIMQLQGAKHHLQHFFWHKPPAHNQCGGDHSWTGEILSNKQPQQTLVHRGTKTALNAFMKEISQITTYGFDWSQSKGKYTAIKLLHSLISYLTWRYQTVQGFNYISFKDL